MELSDTSADCPSLLLCLYAVALNEPTTVSEICGYIERAENGFDAVDGEEIEEAVEFLSENDLVQINVDPYRAYVVSLDTTPGGYDV